MEPINYTTQPNRKHLDVDDTVRNYQATVSVYSDQLHSILDALIDERIQRQLLEKKLDILSNENAKLKSTLDDFKMDAWTARDGENEANCEIAELEEENRHLREINDNLRSEIFGYERIDNKVYELFSKIQSALRSNLLIFTNDESKLNVSVNHDLIEAVLTISNGNYYHDIWNGDDD